MLRTDKFHCEWTRLLLCLAVLTAGVCCQEKSQVFTIAEEEPIGTVIGQVGEPFPDVRPPFWLFADDPSIEEDLDVTLDGLIKVKSKIDREKRGQYEFVMVTEIGQNIRVIITVEDTNDNSPTFPESVINITILESAPRDAKFFIGSASDPDLGEFSTRGYDIVAGNTGNAFRLLSKRASNGVLLLDLAINGHLDYEVTSSYSLTIEAYDGGDPPRIGVMTVNVVIVDANDNSPVFNFTRYHAQVRENATVGTKVLQVFATDVDSGENGKIRYQIDRQRSDPNGNFDINSESGTIVINKELDYEDIKAYELIVVARDNGTQKLQTTAIVSVQVLNINDNAPTISLIFLTDDGTGRISETAHSGDPIARISVTDADDEDRQPVVNVTLGGGEGYFGLTTRDNIVYLIILSKPLDREIKPYYELTVVASDMGTPPLVSTETLTLYVTDTNDNAPRFSQSTYYADIQEIIAPGSSVIQLEAIDEDYGNNSMITYELLRTPGSHWEWFQINNRTGLVTTRSPVDCEMSSEPRLQVVATDSGTPPLSTTVTVIIHITDVNDNQPVFDQSFYNVSIREDAALGSCILQVSASDPDCGANAQVRYAVAANLGFQYPSEFEVQAETGQICIIREVDYEKKHTYDFPIVARDQDNLDTTALVMIVVQDVNDNSPVFYPTQYSVSMDLDTVAISNQVVVVKATDTDSGEYGTVMYDIVGGNEDELFEINRGTGVISLTRTTDLSPSLHTLIVSATDGGGISSNVRANVSVSLRDASLNPPEFTSSLYRFNVDEDAGILTLVGVVEATGRNVIYTILSGDPQGLFHLNPNTGQIRSEQSLDHDTVSSLLLNIQARGEGINNGPPVYGNAQVNITIDDINDNTPEFAVTTVEIPVKEDMRLGSTIYVVHAFDADSGDNGRVRYSIQDPNDIFEVNSESGEISLKRRLDHEMTVRHEFMVHAYDLGPGDNQASMTVIVEVQDINDNAPVFEFSSYVFDVSESRKANFKFGEVQASDADSGNNGKIRYQVQNGQNVDVFGVFADDGFLYNRVKLDRERRHEYLFVVLAVDNGVPSRSSSASVTVRVLDANDNDPIFQNIPYVFQITENQPPHTLVGVVSATDKDETNQLIYFLESSNQYFSVNAESGEVLSSQQLDREERDLHSLTIIVSDQGQPSRTSSVDVKIHVTDVNDNNPRFDKEGVFVAYINENQPADTLVAQITARDSDKGENASITYGFYEADTNHDTAMFNLDTSNGRITTKEVLDHESKAQYVFKLLARDGGSPHRQTLKTVEVIVEDQNESPPQFDTAHTYFSILENTAPGTIVGNVTAKDSDSGENARVTYYIVRGNLFGTFGVHSTTGAIFVSRPVDFEECSRYSLQVRAVDSNTVNPMSSIINVNVSIIDVNDNSPYFEDNPVVITIRENIPAGVHIYTFTALDRDSGDYGRVQFEMVSQSPQNDWFTVERNSGHLKINRQIDFEETKQISIVVKAEDLAKNVSGRLATTVSALIIIEDVNDNSPLFQTRNQVYVLEDEPVGYPVMHIVATDADSQDGGRVSFDIVSGNDHSHFSLDSSTGLLQIAKPLDREAVAQYLLNISAYDHGLPRRTTYMKLTVGVIDVNDSPPVFQHSVYKANISESAVVDTVVTTVHATDRDTDTNAELNYFIPDGVISNQFTIEQSTGVIRSRIGFDREQQSSYVITAYVKDGAFPALYDTATVLVDVLDENDNAPIFQVPLVSLEVPENAHLSVIHTVVASDADYGVNGHLTYSIIGGNTDNKFTLNSTTGQLSCRPLNREQSSLHNLTIEAKDGGNPARTSVSSILISVIDDNDNDPEFLLDGYTAEVFENIAVGTSVLRVQAVDADVGVNAEISYSINNAAQGQFSINNITGVLSTAGEFDREKIAHYSFEVYATDGGLYGPRSESVRVEVTVKDINDNFPVFTQYPYRQEISQDLGVNQRVLQVSATDTDADDNGRIRYSFSTASQFFKIDSTTGVVKTRSLLGPAAAEVHRLNVLAVDQGSPAKSSTGLVEIHVGSALGGILRFTNLTYNVHITEGARFGEHLTRVQARFISNQGSGLIAYSFASGNEDNIFMIHQDTGNITVNEGSKLDFETNPRLRLIVVATANSAYDYTTVWVNLKDSNDNAPKFTQQRYTSSTYEGNSRGTYVAQVIATDLDTGENGRVTYSITSGNTHNAFVIDPPETGIVKTNIILDREIVSTYRLEIEAIDGGRNPLSAICTLKVQIIDVNDNSPFFPAYPPVNIHEGIEKGSFILEVTANDRDLTPELQYMFASDGNPADAFSIDRYSGKITVAKELDHEVMPVYRLRILASDEIHNATAEVLVNLIDDNDNPPVFGQQSYQVSIPELTPPDVQVLTVNATDSDSDDNARLTYSMIAVDGFKIDSITGVIYTNHTVMFNPRQRDMHLVVTAVDHGKPQRSAVAAVRVQVMDVNNHAPKFLPSTYSTSVAEDTKAGSTLLTLTATDDDDLHVNKVIYYSIVSGDVESVFQVMGSTGEIVLVGELDRERRSKYNLVVMGSDRGEPPLNSTAPVTITILDINDNTPVFNSSVYHAQVSEDIAIDEDIVKVSAYDLDAGDNGRLHFNIDSGNDDNKFVIDRDTGVISVRITLDHESRDMHKLVISASDSSPVSRNSAFATVFVNVTDVNEFPPIFPEGLSFVNLQENQRIGSHVFTAHANDRDSGIFGITQYFIVRDEDQSAKENFVINTHTGDVSTAAVFYYNVSRRYSVRVRAVDSGGLYADTTYVVLIQPFTYKRPSFANVNYDFVVPGNAKKGFVVGQIRAMDSGVMVYYSFKNPNEYFAINSTSGVITVTQDLIEDRQENEIVSRKKRRVVSRMTSVQFEHHRQKREMRENDVVLTIVARSGSPTSTYVSEKTIAIQVNRSCEGCALAQSGSKGTLSDTSLVLLIVFATIAIILVVVIVTMYLRGRERKRQPPENSQYDSSSFETIEVPPPPPHIGFAPPAYNERYAGHHIHSTTSEVSEPSRSASSGRGSVEEDEDEEIRMINAAPQQKQALRMPDSGMQDDDAISEHSVNNHQDYLARLGIDTDKINTKVSTAKPAPVASSVESMHYFSDADGGEDVLPVYPAQNAGHHPGPHHQTQAFSYGNAEPSNAGSLSSVINSEEEFSGSYNWDYLLDWGPQYQPLADVFSEIARLKDDNIKPKTKPTQIVPQRQMAPPLPSSQLGRPPPIITDMPPRAVPLANGDSLPSHLSSSSSIANSARTSQLTSVSLPKSPISYESSFTSPAMSPSFTPSLSPLRTRSPSISPLVSPKGIPSSGHSSSGGETPKRRPHKARGIRLVPPSSGSEQEIQI